MSIFLIIFKSVIFWSILFFFGYQLAKWLFKKTRIEVLIALSGVMGIGLYVFLINAIGHFIPIKITFYLVLLIFIIAGLLLMFKNKLRILEWGIDRKWRKILLLIALLLIVITFIVDNRFPLGGDQTLLTGLPSAATIAEGNFPPKAVWFPPHPLMYHYGYHLLSIATYKITGLPLYMGYDMQVAISAGILFLLGFILIKKFIKDNKKALVSSLLMLCAGSLVFFKGIKGISILYNKYILHQDIFAPFKFVFEMVESLFSAPTIERIVHFPTNALGFVLMMAVIYLYFSSAEKINKKIIIVSALLLAVSALFIETFFAVFCLLLITYPFIFWLIKKDWLTARKFLISSLLIVVIAAPIVLIQGGVLSYLIQDENNFEVLAMAHPIREGNTFIINKTPWILMTRVGEDNKLPIYSPEFLLQWGLLLILTILAIIYFWKKYPKYILFLASAFLGFFLIPFFIVFPMNLCSTERFFYPANLFAGLIAGLFLADLYFKKKKWLKKSIIFIAALLVLQGLIFQLIFLTIGYPPGQWNNSGKFFAKENSFEGKAYQWVKKHTTINDYFLIVKPEDDFGMAPNLRFILNTGRIATIYTYFTNPTPEFYSDFPQSRAFKELKKSCRSDLIDYLNYKYLYVNEKWLPGLEEKCLANNNLELKFEANEEERFVRIYKVTNQ